MSLDPRRTRASFDVVSSIVLVLLVALMLLELVGQLHH